MSSLASIATSGADPVCILIQLSNKVADIISALQTYQICEIDNAAEPDMDQRETIAQNQSLVETYDFVSHLLDVVICEPEPGVSDLISLFFDLLGIAPDQPEEA